MAGIGNDAASGFVRAHDDLFQKQIISPGTTLYATPVDSCTCEFTLTKIENVDGIVFPASPVTIGIHDSFPSYIVSRTLQSMTLNEKSKFMFQYEGRVSSFELLLTNFDDKDEMYTWDQNSKLDMCYKLKAVGTELFKKQNNFWAWHNYNRALMFLTFADKRDESLQETKVQLISNIALCQAKLGDGNVEKSIENLSKVIAIDPNNVKAFFRRGKQLISLNRFEEAEVDLEKAYSLDPANKAVVEQQNLLKKKRTQHDDVTANAMAKFFASSKLQES